MRPRQDEIDFAHRILCPDGSCIGVVGPDGRCKVCGTFAGNDVLRQLEADGGVPATATAAVDDAAADGEPEGEAGAEPDADADADFLAERELCPDGNCIGVIGANGRCKVCGTPRVT